MTMTSFSGALKPQHHHHRHSSLYAWLRLGLAGFLVWVVLLRPTPVDRFDLDELEEDQLTTKASVRSVSSRESPQLVVVPIRDEPPLATFRQAAASTQTDKILGYKNLPGCLADAESCFHPDAERDECKPWGHFYDTLYDRWLRPYARADSPPLQFLEIGFFRGWGYDAYRNYLQANRHLEYHAIELSCSAKFVDERNSAKVHPEYQQLREDHRLHCGDSSQYRFLNETWTNHINRPDAPPLTVVIDDGSHVADHMAASLFFWLPKIAPRGILVVEDIQPVVGPRGNAPNPNPFRTHVLPQVMKDVHWCGDATGTVREPEPCFPTLQPLIASVHCEMHICVFVRNGAPAREYDQAQSMVPESAFSISGAATCLFGGPEGV